MGWFRLTPVFAAASVCAMAAVPACVLAQAQPSSVVAGAVAKEAPAIVGETTLVIGVVKLTSLDGSQRALERGAAVRVGDKIETEAGGHVHLRFVDGGRMSVRPLSRLQIENYNHSSQNPELSAIKFRLDEGVVRSITGAWGEAARERFRLNTPVAAIGVKGTDFVVKSDADNTLASVYTGAIVLSPLDQACRGSLGPCVSGAEKLLSEDMKGQMLLLGRAQPAPQVVPAVDLMAQNLRGSTVTAADGSVASKSDNTPRADGGITYAAAVQTIVGDIKGANALNGAGYDGHGQLMWGRWSSASLIDGDLLSRTFSEAQRATVATAAAGAAATPQREATVGNGIFGLYRDNPNGATSLTTGETSASFRLNSSAAQLNTADARVEAVRVNGGSLNLDFARASFSTSLGLSSPSLGNDTLTASGTVTSNGLLLPQSGNAYVAGALSLDAREAGYFFDKSTPAGYLRGITLWGR